MRKGRSEIALILDRRGTASIGVAGTSIAHGIRALRAFHADARLVAESG
jgi:hypothetical protein